MATSTGAVAVNTQESGANTESSEGDSMATSTNAQESGANTESSEWDSSMQIMLGSLTDDRVKPCSIFQVPEHLQNSEKKAYGPKVVSIGPIHRGTKRDLLYTEEIKYRCMLSLLERTDNPSERFTKCNNGILKLDEIVRAFYMDHIKFNNYELAKIMILDGCFLLELLISNAEQSNSDGSTMLQSLLDAPVNAAAQRRNTGEELIKASQLYPITSPSPGSDAASEVRKMGDIHSDLKLIENQIPLTVLIGLFHLLFANEPSRKTYKPIREVINGLALFFFGCTSSPTPVHRQNIAHLLELVHTFLTEKEKEDEIAEQSGHRSITIKTSEMQNYKTTSQLINCCAIRLEAAGVTIMPAGEQRKGTKLRSDRESGVVFGCYTSFRDQTLKIQPLNITEETEIMWRNLIAWEQNRITHEKYLDQNHGRTSCKFSEFALLLKGLICCEDDIEVLKKLKVLVVRDEKKWSNEKLMIFFREIHSGIQIYASKDSECGQMIKSSSCCGGNVKIIRHNCRRIRTKVQYELREWFRILKRDHASTVWQTVGVIAAAVLLLLTIAQTVLAGIALRS